MTSAQRPNIIFVMADDHAAHAISAYGSRINETPHIDRLASAGIRFDACFCTNSLCSPSRATILTGTYNELNGVTTLDTLFDNRQPTFPDLLRSTGYQTAIVGKWHLGHGGIHDPRGFDHWLVLPDQGAYHDPELIGPDGPKRYDGYVTDILTDLAIDWLEARDRARPFLLMLTHKAPHRSWEPDAKHASLFADLDIPEPPTLRDDYVGRSRAAADARMRIERDLGPEDLKALLPPGIAGDEKLRWTYQRYIKDYLRCVASIDDNVGRLLDWLDDAGLAEDTLVAYTSDQGFFLGDHGWYDKRFMYEESLRMPLLVRYGREVPAGSVSDEIVLNVDFARTFLDLAGVPPDPRMQGRSLRPILRGRHPDDWRPAMYYRYWMHDDSIHHVWGHRGVRTTRYKLVRYEVPRRVQEGSSDAMPSPPSGNVEWELFDLERDPFELRSVYDDAEFAPLVGELTRELERLERLAEMPGAPL
jgi:arylsulfatase A-like enzyme